MKFNQKRVRRRCSGGVLVLALVLTSAATVGFAAWASLISQRAQGIEQLMAGTKRRLAVQNGIAIARQYSYQMLASAAGSTAAMSLSNDWGAVSIPTWSGYAMESVTPPAGVNVFSPSGSSDPVVVYARWHEATVETPIYDFDRVPVEIATPTTKVLSMVKSRSPLCSGDVLIFHRPTLAKPAPAVTVTGNIQTVGGRMVLFNPLSPNSFKAVNASQVVTPGYITATPSTFQLFAPAGQTTSTLLPSNLVLPAVSGGSVSSSVDTTGKLNVIEDATNGGNSFRDRIQYGSWMELDTSSSIDERGVSFDSSTGILTLNLAEPDLPSVIAHNNLSQIVLTGQNAPAEETAADSYAASGLCYVEDAATTTRNLTSIVCNGTGNQRRFILGVKKVTPADASGNAAPGGGVSINFTNSASAPIWRLMMVAENTPLTVSATGGPGTITMIGGIQADSSLAAPTGTANLLKLLPEASPLRLNRLAPRFAWVETYLDFVDGDI